MTQCSRVQNLLSNKSLLFDFQKYFGNASSKDSTSDPKIQTSGLLPFYITINKTHSSVVYFKDEELDVKAISNTYAHLLSAGTGNCLEIARINAL